jgi:fusion and transport protein UGO1
MTFSVAKFCAASAALFVKLPLETVLRRAQMAVLSSRRVLASSSEPSLQPLVPPGAYKGVIGTMYHISAREGSRPAPGGPSKKRIRGQGIAGLTRGWTVNFIGLVGLWTTGIMSTGGEDDVF